MKRLNPAIPIDREAVTAYLKGTLYAPVLSLSLLNEGRIATNYQLATAQGPLYCRLYPHDYCYDRLAFEVDVLRYLHQRRIPVPEAIALHSGERIFADGRYLGFFYIPLAGKTLRQTALSPRVAGQAGKLLRRFLDEAARYPCAGEPVNEYHRVRTLCCDGAAALHGAVSAGHQRQIANFLAGVKYENWLNASPRSLLHGDYFFENVVVRDGDIVGMIDFGDVYHGRMPIDIIVGCMEFSVLTDNGWDYACMYHFLTSMYDKIRFTGLNADIFIELVQLQCLKFFFYTFSLDETDTLNPYLGRFLALHEDDKRRALAQTFNRLR
ncbi:phosphotransferase [Affinibrenneria salicis]|nr:phosphotransferase [Affinibrenneria salicis]